MVVFAYCRVSTVEQSSMLQEYAILKAYPEAVVQHEKKSGTTKAGRDVLNSVLGKLNVGDKLVVWKLDRLARNMSDLLAIVDFIESQGASLEILDQRIDTSTAAGRAFYRCWGCLQSLKPIFAANDKPQALLKPKESALKLTLVVNQA